LPLGGQTPGRDPRRRIAKPTHVHVLPTLLMGAQSNGDDPVVTVVVSVGNDAQSLAETLRSLQRQTFPSWEAVLVHGGVEEAIPPAVSRLSQGDGRIRFIEHRTRHGVDLRRAGVATARGQWIAFLGCGERLLPSALQIRLEAAQACGTRVIHSDGYVVEATGVRCLGVRPLAGRVFNDLLRDEGPEFAALLVHKNALRTAGVLDGRFLSLQAWDLTLRLARHFLFGFEPTPTFVGASPGVERARSSRDAAREYERFVWKHWRALFFRTGPGVVATHYQQASARYADAAAPIAEARCRAVAWVAYALERARVFRMRRPRVRSDGRTIFQQRSTIDAARISAGLSERLQVEIKSVTAEFQAGQSGSVHRVEFLDAAGERRSVVLKDVEDERDYTFYQRILEPFNLDSPHMFGHITAGDRLLLVMDYIPHAPVRFSAHDRFVQAARWLAKKDRIVHDNFHAIISTGYFTFDSARPPFTRTIEDCIDIIRRGVERAISPLLSRAFLRCLRQRLPLLYDYAGKIFRAGPLTVCHRDFHIKNILFPSEDAGRIYVVDWSRPEIDSVCIDLARLVLTAPLEIRDRLIEVYREGVDFEDFEAMYDRAELLVALTQFAWGFSVILEGRRGAFSTSEVRKVRRLQTDLVSRLQLGIE
jgi:glycosyltransferase involved in cell wall biosynthesis